MKRLGVFIFLLIMSLMLSTCKESGSVAPYYLKDMTGTVRLVLEDGTPKRDCSGVKVYLEGVRDTALTDSAGRWNLLHVRTGTYNLVALKAGFGYNKFLSLPMPASNIGQTLLEAPSYTIRNLTVSMQHDTVSIQAEATTVGSYRRVPLVFFGRVPPIYDSVETWLGGTGGGGEIAQGSRQFNYLMLRSWLLEMGFRSGETIHVAVYPGSRWHEAYYLTELQKEVSTTGIAFPPSRATFVLP